MTQNEQILKHLRDGNAIDPMSALNLFNCWALRSRICEIEGKSEHPKMLAGDEVVVRGWAETPSGKRHRTYSLINSKAAAEWDRMKVKA